MGLFSEKEPIKNKYESTEEATPLNIERKEVVSPVPIQFKAQVTDGNGEKIIDTPENKKIEIKIPEINEEILREQTKSSKDEAKAWSAGFLLRIIKKALHFGWKVVFGR